MHLAAVFAQAGLALALVSRNLPFVHFFHPQALRLCSIFVIGALVRQFLPERARPHAMLTASILGMLVTFPPALTALVLVAFVFLVAVGRSNLPFWPKVLFSLFVLVPVLIWRSETGNSLQSQVAALLAPILFLRIYCFIVDSKTGSWREALSYFLSLPSFAFPVFPVLDFSKFRSEATSRREVVERGADFMVIGALQITLLQVVDALILVRFGEIVDLRTLVLHLFHKYSGYVEISGTFLLGVGLLRLYGYDLQPSTKLFLFPVSFADYWRRGNTYWRDFMSRHVFFPSYLRFRRYGESIAWISSTALVFALSCLLHVYFFYCVLGRLRFSWRDVVFWGVFGLGAIAATSLALRPGSKATSLGFLASAFRITAMFVAASLLYAYWLGPSTPSPGEIAARIAWNRPGDYLWLLAFPAVGAIGATARGAEGSLPTWLQNPSLGFRRRDWLNLGLLALGFLTVALLA